MSEPQIVTGYEVSLELRHLTKNKDELDVCISYKTAGSGEEAVYILRPAQALDLIAKIADRVNLVMAEKWHGQ